MVCSQSTASACTGLCGAWTSARTSLIPPCHGSMYNRKDEMLAGVAPCPSTTLRLARRFDTLVLDTSNPLKRAVYEPSQAYPLSTKTSISAPAQHAALIADSRQQPSGIW